MQRYFKEYLKGKFWTSILSHYLAFLLCISLAKFLVILGISFLEQELPLYTTTIQWHKFILRVFFGTLVSYISLTGIFLCFFLISWFGRFKIWLFSLEICIVLTTVLGFLFLKYYNYLPQYSEILTLKLVQAKELGTFEFPFLESLTVFLVSIVFLFWIQKKLENHFDEKPKRRLWVSFVLLPIVLFPFAIYQFKPYSLSVLSIELIQKDPLLYVLSSYIEYQKSHSEAMDLQDLKRSYLYDPKKFRSPKNVPLLREKKDYTPPSKQVIGKIKHYNIIFFLLESIPPFIAGETIQGKTIAPKLKKILDSSLNFGRVFMSGVHSIEGRESIYYSTYPPIMDMINQKAQNNLSFVQILEKQGYHTSSMTSVKSNWFLAGWSTRLVGHRNFYGLGDYKKESPQHFNRVENDFIYQTHHHVRAPDHFLLESLDKQIESYQAQKKEPFFITFTTSTNHAPYKPYPENGPVKKLIPEPREPYEFFLNTYHYTGEILAEWILQSKSKSFFQNTLFVLVSDHKPMSLDLRKIPFLKNLSSFEQNLSIFAIYNPTIIQEKSGLESIEKQRGSHADIGPTLLNLLGIPEGKTFFLGQSLIQDETYSDRMIPLPRANTILYQDYIIIGDEVTRQDRGSVTHSERKEILEKVQSFRKDLKLYQRYYRNIIVHRGREIFQMR